MGRARLKSVTRSAGGVRLVWETPLALWVRWEGPRDGVLSLSEAALLLDTTAPLLQRMIERRRLASSRREGRRVVRVCDALALARAWGGRPPSSATKVRK